MTYCSSSNIPMLRSKVINLSFVDQALSIDVFISTVRPPQRNLDTRLTKLAVVLAARIQIGILADLPQATVLQATFPFMLSTSTTIPTIRFLLLQTPIQTTLCCL